MRDVSLPLLLVAGLLLGPFVPSAHAQQPDQSSTMDQIRKKVNRGNVDDLTEKEKNTLKRHIRKREMRSLKRTLKNNADLNNNGRLDSHEQNIMKDVLKHSNKLFKNELNRPGNEHGPEAARNNGPSTGNVKGLEKGLKKAQQAMERGNRGGNGDRNGPPGNRGRSNKGRPEETKRGGNNPIAEFARSLRQRFQKRRERLLNQKKGKNMRNNPINRFARSIRKRVLSRVAQKAEKALNNVDKNGDGRVSQGELPGPARGKGKARGRGRGKGGPPSHIGGSKGKGGPPSGIGGNRRKGSPPSHAGRKNGSNKRRNGRRGTRGSPENAERGDRGGNENARGPDRNPGDSGRNEDRGANSVRENRREHQGADRGAGGPGKGRPSNAGAGGGSRGGGGGPGR